MIVLDTHVLLWLRYGEGRLGKRARRILEDAWLAGDAAVSAISFWEIAMLHDRRRLTLLRDIESWRGALLAEGLVEIPVDGQVGIRAARLADFHGDPADRLIVATALEGQRLATADRRILDWGGPLDRVDVRE